MLGGAWLGLVYVCTAVVLCGIGGLFQCPRCASASSPPPRRARRSSARPAQHPHATHSSDRLSGSASHDRTCHLGDSQRRSQPVIATQKHAHPAVWSPDRHNPQEECEHGSCDD
jgi:hypothetical protein